MNIVFATSGLDFNGDTLNKGSLGGSETALASMAREMAKLGHNVMVFCRCSKPGMYDGVVYDDLKNYIKNCRNMSIDVQVISRFGNLWHPEINASINVWWMHDMPSSKEQTMMYVLKADLVAMLSQYHEDCYRLSGAPLDKVIWRTKNGVDLDVVDAAPPCQPSHPCRFVYSSLPERGLEILTQKIWPKIREQLPNAELVIAGYDLSSIQQMIDDDTRHKQGAILEAARSTPGVKMAGPLCKSQLYSLMKGSTAMLYPVTFPEIFCITAVEAQACRLPIVTTNNYALPETVGPDSGFLIEPGVDYVDKFVSAAVCAAADRASYGEAGRKFVEEKGFVWSRIAKEWEQKFESIFRDRRANEPYLMMATMRQAGDIQQAKWLATTSDLYAPTPREVLVSSKPLSTPKQLTQADEEVVANIAFDIWKYHTKTAGKTVLDLSGTSSFSTTTRTQDDSVRVDHSQDNYEPHAGGYDAVYIADMLAYHPKPDELLALCQQYLKSDGYVISATPQGTLQMGDSIRQQLWSFTSDDLRYMSTDLKSFASVFANMYVSDRGDKQGYWITCFSAAGAPKRLDLLRRCNRYRPMKALTACIIAKNEEKWINMCLSELQHIADQIVVVDCESTDRTRQLALAMGAEVVTTKFEDFSQARNISLEAARGDWVLWIDCDERLVNAERIRKYLDYPLPESYTIRQNHLIVDGNKDVDMPARLVRNRPHHRFVGKIHEHCEDISDPDILSKAIAPCFEAGDLDIAHYGYVHEHQRRKKALMRNMDLLIEDARVNLPKGRTLTWALAMRDYLNAVKWHYRHIMAQRIDEGSMEHDMCEAVISTYFAIFNGRIPGMEKLVYPFYQEACGYLSKSQLSYRPIGRIPFQAALMLAADNKAMEAKEVSSMRPDQMWFVHPDEMRAFSERNNVAINKRLFADYAVKQPAFEWKFTVEAPDPVKMLTTIRETYKRG